MLFSEVTNLPHIQYLVLIVHSMADYGQGQTMEKDYEKSISIFVSSNVRIIFHFTDAGIGRFKMQVLGSRKVGLE